MKKNTSTYFLAIALLFCSGGLYAQGVGIGTNAPDASAQLDISNRNHGVLIPRMTSATILTIVQPAKGLIVYDSTLNVLMVNTGSASAPNWQNIAAGKVWNLSGNRGTDPAKQFIGTTDSAALSFRMNNVSSGVIDSAHQNVLFGYHVGGDNMDLRSATQNTAIGALAMAHNTTGFTNSVLGANALMNNTTGFQNVALGTFALEFGVTGSDNTAVGVGALGNNRGNNNTAIGKFSLDESQTGDNNVAVGSNALMRTSGASNNTVVGTNSLTKHPMGFNNVVLGANCEVTGDNFFNIIAVGQGVTVMGSNQARFGNIITFSIGGFASWTNFSDGRFKKDMKEDVKGTDFIMRLRPVTYRLDITGIHDKMTAMRQTAVKGGVAESAPDATMKQAMAAREKVVFSGFSAQEVEKAAQDAGYDFSGVDKPASPDGFYGLRYADFVVPMVKTVQEQQMLLKELQKKLERLEKLAK